MSECRGKRKTRIAFTPNLTSTILLSFVPGSIIGVAVSLKCYACVDCAENGLQVQDCTNILGLDIKSDHCIKTVTNTRVSKLFRVLSPSGRENSQAVYIKVKVATLQSRTMYATLILEYAASPCALSQ